MGIRARWNQMGWHEKKLWVIGGDGAMYDIGFQSLSRMVASGADIKVLVLDTQVYSNTGGQASTATFGGQVTKLSAASFAPFFTPDGKRIIFCTNYFATDQRKRNFDLAVINIDGTGLERITFNETFDGFPMFSPDGKKLVFASNRNAAKTGDTNVFIADWVE